MRRLVGRLQGRPMRGHDGGQVRGRQRRGVRWSKSRLWSGLRRRQRRRHVRREMRRRQSGVACRGKGRRQSGQVRWVNSGVKVVGPGRVLGVRRGRRVARRNFRRRVRGLRRRQQNGRVRRRGCRLRRGQWRGQRRRRVRWDWSRCLGRDLGRPNGGQVRWLRRRPRSRQWTATGWARALAVA